MSGALAIRDVADAPSVAVNRKASSVPNPVMLAPGTATMPIVGVRVKTPWRNDGWPGRLAVGVLDVSDAKLRGIVLPTIIEGCMGAGVSPDAFGRLVMNGQRSLWAAIDASRARLAPASPFLAVASLYDTKEGALRVVVVEWVSGYDLAYWLNPALDRLEQDVREAGIGAIHINPASRKGWSRLLRSRGYQTADGGLRKEI